MGAAAAWTDGDFNADPAGDAKVYVSFDLHPVLDQTASDEAGRPVHKEVEYVRIAVPGDKSLEVHRPLSAADRQRFARQYEAWRKSGQNAVVGTPVTEVSWISRAQAADLKHFSVHTVEQLAELADSTQGLGPIQKLKARAKLYLEQAKGAAPALQLQTQLEERDARIAALERTVADLSGKLDARDGKGKKP